MDHSGNISNNSELDNSVRDEDGEDLLPGDDLQGESNVLHDEENMHNIEGEEELGIEGEQQEGEDDGEMYANEENEELEDEMGNQQEGEPQNEQNLSKVSEKQEIEIEDDISDNLPLERKVRFRVLRFIDKLRERYNLSNFYNDTIGNNVAMSYAKYLLKEKENENELVK